MLDKLKSAEVKVFYEDGTVGTYGRLNRNDILDMLRGCEYDEEFDMWFNKKNGQWAYALYHTEYANNTTELKGRAK